MYNADLYRKNNNLQQNLAMACLEKHESKITWRESKNRILDIGCGEGTVSIMLKKYFPNNFTFLGCDINENMVKLANDKHLDEKVSFTVLDITGDVPEKMKGSFSHIFSFFAINWIRDQKSTFKNIYNLMETGGECFLEIVTSTPIFEVYRSFECNTKWNNWVYDVERYISPYHDYQDPKKELMKMMFDIGFHNVDIQDEEVSYIFEDMEAMKNTLKAVNPFKIPLEKYNEFWNDYFELWKKFEGLDQYGRDYFANGIEYKFKVLIVHAQK